MRIHGQERECGYIGPTLTINGLKLNYLANRNLGCPVMKNPALLMDVSDRFSPEQLKSHIQSGTIYTVYQPQLSLGNRRIGCLELLSRWRDDAGQYVSPDLFIPLIEACELETDLLRAQLAQLSLLVARHPEYTGRFSVNVSQRALGSAKFRDDVEDVLRQLDFPTDRLIMEVTERLNGLGLESTIAAQFSWLTDVGIKLSLDDFGTDNATLDLLNKYSFYQVKIDRRFLHQARDSQRAALMLQGMVSLAHSVDSEVSIEGVETLADLMLVMSSKADMAQGYFIGAPAPMDQLNLY